MQTEKQLIQNLEQTTPVFSSFDKVYWNKNSNRIQVWGWSILGGLILALFLPWTQTIRSKGLVTTLRQEQRPQDIPTVIGGRILEWKVKEGDYVKKGDTLVLLGEIKEDYLDPQLLQRTKEVVDSKASATDNYKGKMQSVNEQISALEQTREWKMKQIANKTFQQSLKISADSLDLVAAQSDFQIKSFQFKRQQSLYDSGLVSLAQLEQRKQSFIESQAKKNSAQVKLDNSRQEFERLKMEQKETLKEYEEKLAKALGDRYSSNAQVATGEGELAKMKNQLANYSIRNKLYAIVAPQNGQVVRAYKKGVNEIVKEGEKLLYFVPSQRELAVEIFVKPVDLTLLDTGQTVRVFFDGFPALVFSGWPQASYGTFSGKVMAIDNAAGPDGLFRVLVKEDASFKPWPRLLKVGAGTEGLALLNDVPLWYEFWRNVNGFPPDFYKGSEKEKSK